MLTGPIKREVGIGWETRFRVARFQLDQPEDEGLVKGIPVLLFVFPSWRSFSVPPHTGTTLNHQRVYEEDPTSRAGCFVQIAVTVEYPCAIRFLGTN